MKDPKNYTEEELIRDLMKGHEDEYRKEGMRPPKPQQPQPPKSSDIQSKRLEEDDESLTVEEILGELPPSSNLPDTTNATPEEDGSHNNDTYTTEPEPSAPLSLTETDDDHTGPYYSAPQYLLERPDHEQHTLASLLKAYDEHVDEGTWPHVLPYTTWHDALFAYYCDWMTSWFPSINKAAKHLNLSHVQLLRYRDQQSKPSANVYYNVTRELFQHAMDEFFPGEFYENRTLHAQTPLYPPEVVGWILRILARERYFALPDGLRKSDMHRSSFTRLVLKSDTDLYLTRAYTYLKACYLITYMKPHLLDTRGYEFAKTQHIKPAKEPPAILELKYGVNLDELNK